MPKNSRHWAIIPAAGTSQRMGGETPKQYLPLGETTVIEASLSCFLSDPEISGVVVALNADDQSWNDLGITRNEKIHTVMGGESRAESVFNAVLYLDNTPAEDHDFVLVHDAARPCLHKKDLDSLMCQLAQDDVGGILASPVSDTLKQVDANNAISKTLDRSMIWKAFTPQMFRLGLLKKALIHCSQSNLKVTDEASAIEAMGYEVKVVEGRSDNIKVTHTEDLEMAAFILKKITD